LAPKAVPGLRERQKQERRALILKGAKRLFEAFGIDETSMAAIAAEVGVSTPTVFNYFGSRDELLLAIIVDGHEREVRKSQTQRSTDSIADDICGLLSDFTRGSLRIFNKAVWRYADSTAIRQPNSAFVKRYSQIDIVLMETIAGLLDNRPCQTRRGGPYNSDALAAIIYNHWNSHYIAYIKDDDMTIEAHLERMLPQVRELLDLVFESA
jgi:AcrR family transcriptional regulator